MSTRTANATVMFTDIRDFTPRASRETRTGLEELLKTHESLLLPVIAHYGGRVVKSIGDAFLVVFESPTNAVLCGVLIQQRLRVYNKAAPPEKQIQVRVAINSGEVTIVGNDVFGEPVNITARIEGITEPGEVYFTESVYLSMQKSEVPSSEVGQRVLKGIPEPIKVYRVIQADDNALYRRIVESATIAPTTAAPGTAAGLEWPPRQGRLRAQARGTPVLLGALAACVVGGAYLATQAWREAHRYDGARAALAAGAFMDAAEAAGGLWSRRPDDGEAQRLLGAGLRAELDRRVKAADRQGVKDLVTRAEAAWPGAPLLPALARDADLASAQLALAAGDHAAAAAAAGRAWARDATDPEATRLLGEALRARLRGAEAAKDKDGLIAALADARTAWPTLPSLAALEREGRLALARVRLGAGEAGPALEMAHQLFEADKTDEAVASLIAAAALADLRTAIGRNDWRAFETRFEECHKRYAGVATWKPVRAAMLREAGTALLTRDSGQQGWGANMLELFVRENPDDVAAVFEAQVLLGRDDRLSSLTRLEKCLASDPALAARPEAAEVVQHFLERTYDRDDEEDVAARAFAWRLFAAALRPVLAGWLARDTEAPDAARLNAFVLLDAAGEVTHAQRDAHHLWRLLQLQINTHDPEWGEALVHWERLVAADAAAAAARAAEAMPPRLPKLNGLNRGVHEKDGVDFGARFRAVVLAVVFDALRPHLDIMVVGSRYPSERDVSRQLLAARGLLTDEVAAASHARTLHEWDGRWVGSDLKAALAFFGTADPAIVGDRAELSRVLRDIVAIADERLKRLEESRADPREKRWERESYGAVREAAQKAAARFPESAPK